MASSNGNDNFKRKPSIPNHDLLSTDADIKTKYILLSLKLCLLCRDGQQEEPICHSRDGDIDATRAGLCSGDNDPIVNENRDHPEINDNQQRLNKTKTHYYPVPPVDTRLSTIHEPHLGKSLSLPLPCTVDGIPDSRQFG